jgi:hypothetical protein
MLSLRSREDNFVNEFFVQNKTPYIYMTAVKFVPEESMTRKVSASKDVVECRDSCTYDDSCKGFLFDSVKDDCNLLYDINGYVRNKDGLFTTTSGLKLREFIDRSNEQDRKLMRFEDSELPPNGQGKLAQHQFIQSVDDCHKKCIEHNNPTGKCIAFEYDFKAKACTLNSEIAGQLNPKKNKDTYMLIN